MDKDTRIEQVIDCPHTLRCLHRAGIETVGQLREYSYDDLLKLRGVGPVIARSVVERVGEVS